MFLAPDSCNHSACVSVQGHCRHCVSSSSFDRCHVKAKGIAALMGTSNVKICMALQTGYTCSVVRLAELANLVVAKRACTNSLHHVKASSVAKLHLWMPKRALHVNPVVICSTLKWLTRNNRPAFLLLTGAVLLSGDFYELSLHALFFSVSVALLLVGNFRLLIQVLFSNFEGTKNTLVGLDDVRLSDRSTKRKQLT